MRELFTTILLITRLAWTLAYSAALIALGWGWVMPTRVFEYLVLTGLMLAM